MTVQTLETDLQSALAALRGGEFERAEGLYRQILAQSPHEASALRNLALILMRRGEAESALSLAMRATEVAPETPDNWRAQIRALAMVGRFEAATQMLADRLQQDPARDDLEATVRRAWAQVLMNGDSLTAAEEQLRRVARLQVADVEAFMNLGRVQVRREDWRAAAESFRAALRLDPDHLATQAHLGDVLFRLEGLEEAEGLFRKVLDRSPADPTALYGLGAVLNKLGRHQEALDHAQRGLALRPGMGTLLIIRGDAERDLERYEAALASYEAAERSGGYSFVVAHRRGELLRRMGRYGEALTSFDKAEALRPGGPDVQVTRGVTRLTMGDFAGGWPLYQQRWRQDAELAGWGWVSAELVERMALDARPDDLNDRKVLLVAEQGIGDEVMFASLIPDVLSRTASVTCACDPRLLRLFSNSFPNVRFLNPRSSQVRYSDFDIVLPMSGLARLFRNRLEDFPGRAFLEPGPAIVGDWAERLGARPPGLRIGLSWRGGTALTNAARRSVALDQLAPVLDLPGCEFVSLQYGEVAEEVSAASERLGRPIRLFAAADIDDFEDLAGLIRNLDVVVSVQTALVHLSGAIGAECHALIPYSPEWRYMAQSSAMPWYGSVTLHRQSEPGAWAPVVQEAADDLRCRIDSPQTGA